VTAIRARWKLVALARSPWPAAAVIFSLNAWNSSGSGDSSATASDTCIEGVDYERLATDRILALSEGHPLLPAGVRQARLERRRRSDDHARRRRAGARPSSSSTSTRASSSPHRPRHQGRARLPRRHGPASAPAYRTGEIAAALGRPGSASPRSQSPVSAPHRAATRAMPGRPYGAPKASSPCLRPERTH
jgi:hypothetical protein